MQFPSMQSGSTGWLSWILPVSTCSQDAPFRAISIRWSCLRVVAHWIRRSMLSLKHSGRGRLFSILATAFYRTRQLLTSSGWSHACVELGRAGDVRVDQGVSHHIGDRLDGGNALFASPLRLSLRGGKGLCA